MQQTISACQGFSCLALAVVYLLYDRCLHAARLHLLLQEDLLLGLRDDVLSPVGSANHLQDLAWEDGRDTEVI